MVDPITLAIGAKVVAVLKGAAVVMAHKGLTIPVVHQFAAMMSSAGLLAALKWLIATLTAAGAAVMIVEALQRLATSIEEGNPVNIVEAAYNAFAKTVKSAITNT